MSLKVIFSILTLYLLLPIFTMLQLNKFDSHKSVATTDWEMVSKKLVEVADLLIP